MFVAFFDESGHSSNTDFFALAAVVADWRHWREFNARWNAALRTHEAPYLHMREFAHRRGAFTDWTEARRRLLLAECLDALDGLDITAVGAVMRVSAFRKLTDEEQSEFADPTFCCFQDCLHGVLLNAYRDFWGMRTDVVYSKQDEFGPKIRKLFSHLSRFGEDGANLGALRFHDMRTEPALQLADLVAYELRHFYDRVSKNPDEPPRYPFRRLVDYQQAQGAAMFRFIPGWMMEFQAKGLWLPAQNVIWNEPHVWGDLIRDLIPPFLYTPAFVRRIARGHVVGIMKALRAGALR